MKPSAALLAGIFFLAAQGSRAAEGVGPVADIAAKAVVLSRKVAAETKARGTAAAADVTVGCRLSVGGVLRASWGQMAFQPYVSSVNGFSPAGTPRHFGVAFLFEGGKIAISILDRDNTEEHEGYRRARLLARGETPLTAPGSLAVTAGRDVSDTVVEARCTISRP